MPKKKPEKAMTTPAAPKAPAPIPAFLADLPTSALASSTSARISVDRSAIALWTSVPTDGSSPAAVRTAGAALGALDTLWATGGSSCRCARARGSMVLVRGMVPHDAGPRAAGLSRSVLRGGGGQLVLDHVHHRRVGQRRHVAELAVLGDVPQQPPHDLAGPGLRQLLHDHDLAGLGDGPDVAGDVVAQGLHELVTGVRPALAEDHERDDALPGGRVAGTHDRRLGHGRVADQGGLDLRRGDAVARDVHDVVHPAEQPDVAVGVLLGAVPGEVDVLAEPRPVGVDVPVVV